MHSRLLLRLAHWPARHRPARPWASREASPLGPDRVPGESYRDYLFRKSIGWS
jgi:hypothetical protein